MGWDLETETETETEAMGSRDSRERPEQNWPARNTNQVSGWEHTTAIAGGRELRDEKAS